jgi:hypothetical protein
MNKVRIAILGVAAVILIVSFAGKTMMARDTNGGSITESIGSAVASMLKGDVTGEVGKTYSTQWFNFSVLSIDKVTEYAGYKPEESNILVDVKIAELCTFNEDTDMSYNDFYLDSDSFEEYVFPIEPLDDTMMPEEFTLKPKEKVEYHIVYEFPEETKGLKLMYTEIDEAENEGATFTINIPD